MDINKSLIRFIKYGVLPVHYPSSIIQCSKYMQRAVELEPNVVLPKTNMPSLIESVHFHSSLEWILKSIGRSLL